MEKKFVADKLQMEKEFRETMAFVQSEHATEKKSILNTHSEEIKRRDEEKARIAKKHLV